MALVECDVEDWLWTDCSVVTTENIVDGHSVVFDKWLTDTRCREPSE